VPLRLLRQKSREEKGQIPFIIFFIRKKLDGKEGPGSRKKLVIIEDIKKKSTFCTRSPTGIKGKKKGERAWRKAAESLGKDR